MSAPFEKKQNFRLYTDADFRNAEPTSWIVKDVIPEHGIGAMFGPSGTFKSFLVLDMMAHVADGRPWMGKPTKKTPCVYVPFEGRGGVPKRVEAWRTAMELQTIRPSTEGNLGFSMDCGRDGEPFTTGIHFIMEPLSLLVPEDLERLIQTLKDAGLTGCLICIDTLAQAGAGLDENSSEMGKLLAIIHRLQHELSCTVIVIHHTGKDETRGMRGWSGIHAAMDFEMECQRDDPSQKNGVIWLKKVKDGEDGVPLSNFAMQVVQLGPDEDGDLRTSLVVVQPAMPNFTACTNTEPSDSGQDADDDDFVWEWVNREVRAGEFPTGRSLEGQREQQMKQERHMTQKRLRDAVSRLRAASRLVDAPDKAPSGNRWMRAVDVGPS